jgi:uncharacterized damage-inducible protein DinB
MFAGGTGAHTVSGSANQSGRLPGVADSGDSKVVLKRYLQRAREALVWKVEDLSEREARLPRTPTGTNLLGIVKHATGVEAGYFGATFGREWPRDEAWDDDEPQADFYATAAETKDGIISLYRWVWTYADEAIDGLALDARGTVPWWPPERASVTLNQVLVHVISDLTRHAGHADILREQIDGAVGVTPDNSNVPEFDWAAYRSKLTALADQFGDA